MRDVSYFLAFFGVLSLLVAGLAWGRIYAKPDEQPPTKGNVIRSRSASRVIFVAFFLSAVAAAVAVVGWVFKI